MRCDFCSNVWRAADNIPVPPTHGRTDRLLPTATVCATRGRCGRLPATRQVLAALHVRCQGHGAVASEYESVINHIYKLLLAQFEAALIISPLSCFVRFFLFSGR